MLVTCLSVLLPSVCSASSCPLFSLSTSLTAAAQPCNQLIVHEGARTKAGKFRLTRQRGPETIASALGLSWGLMACDRLFLTDSVTNFSILDVDFWTLGSCHTAESHDPIDQSAFWWQSFQQWSFQTRGDQLHNHCFCSVLSFSHDAAPQQSHEWHF